MTAPLAEHLSDEEIAELRAFVLRDSEARRTSFYALADDSWLVSTQRFLATIDALKAERDEYRQRVEFILTQFADFKAAAFDENGRSWAERFRKLSAKREGARAREEQAISLLREMRQYVRHLPDCRVTLTFALCGGLAGLAALRTRATVD